MATEQIFFQLNLDTGQTIKTFGQLKSETKALRKELDKTKVGTRRFEELKNRIGENSVAIRRFNRDLRKGGTLAQGVAKGMISAFKQVGVALLAGFAVRRLIDFAKELQQTAIQMEAFARRAEIVFGDSAKEVEDFAKENARSLGLSESAFIGAAAAVGDILVPLGLSRDVAAEMSTQAVQLGSALKEFTGDQRSAAEISEVVAKAFTGEVEGLKSLGVVVNQNDKDFKALIKTKIEDEGLSESQAKATAIFETVLLRSSDAIRSFEDNEDSLVRQQAKLNADTQTLIDSLAQGLVPVFSKVIGVLTSITGGFISLFAATNKESDAIREQQIELNVLVGRITDVNVAEEDRVRLIEELNTEFPELLVNLNAETVTNQELAKSLAEVNAQFINRIIVQKQVEKIEEALIELADEVLEQTEIKLELDRAIFKEAQRLGRENQLADKSLKERIELLGLNATALRTTGRQLIELRSTTQNVITGFAEFTRATTNVKNASKALNAVEAEKKAILDALGITIDKNTEDTEENTEAVKDNTKANKENEEFLKKLQKIREALEKAQDDAIEKRAKSEADFQKQLRKQAKDRGKTEAELEEKRFKERLKRAGLFEKSKTELLPEQLAAREELERQHEDNLSKIRLDAKEEQKTIDEKTFAEEEEQRQRNIEGQKLVKELALQGANDLFNAVSQLAKEGSGLQKTAAVFQIATDTARGISGAVAAAQSIPFPGNLAAIAIGVASVLAGIAQAKAVLSQASFAEGGFTGESSQAPDSTGERPAGIVHAGEWVASKSMVDNPVTGGIIRQLEGARQHKFADGGFTSFAPTISPISDTFDIQGQTAALSRVLRALPNPQVSVVEFDRVRNRVTTVEQSASS